MQVNNNGVLSFSTAVSTFTPTAFPLMGDLTLIAPYWADVDTRPRGEGAANNSVWYRMTSDPALLSRARDQVLLAFIDQTDFFPTFVFVATWDEVGYFRDEFSEKNGNEVEEEVAFFSEITDLVSVYYNSITSKCGLQPHLLHCTLSPSMSGGAH